MSKDEFWDWFFTLPVDGWEVPPPMEIKMHLVPTDPELENCRCVLVPLELALFDWDGVFGGPLTVRFD